jgi:hypothetical protein
MFTGDVQIGDEDDIVDNRHSDAPVGNGIG